MAQGSPYFELTPPEVFFKQEVPVDVPDNPAPIPDDLELKRFYLESIDWQSVLDSHFENHHEGKVSYSNDPSAPCSSPNLPSSPSPR